MKTPLAISVIFVMYVVTVLAGPSLMKGRNPVNLRLVLIPYNFALVVLSVYMFYEVSNKQFNIHDPNTNHR